MGIYNSWNSLLGLGPCDTWTSAMDAINWYGSFLWILEISVALELDPTFFIYLKILVGHHSL